MRELFLKTIFQVEEKVKVLVFPHWRLCFSFQVKTRADTAQTHGPPCSVKISFLLHNASRTCSSSPTAVPGLWPGWDMFVLVCSIRYE